MFVEFDSNNASQDLINQVNEINAICHILEIGERFCGVATNEKNAYFVSARLIKNGKDIFIKIDEYMEGYIDLDVNYENFDFVGEVSFSGKLDNGIEFNSKQALRSSVTYKNMGKFNLVNVEYSLVDLHIKQPINYSGAIACIGVKGIIGGAFEFEGVKEIVSYIPGENFYEGFLFIEPKEDCERLEYEYIEALDRSARLFGFASDNMHDLTYRHYVNAGEWDIYFQSTTNKSKINLGFQTSISDRKNLYQGILELALQDVKKSNALGLSGTWYVMDHFVLEQDFLNKFVSLESMVSAFSIRDYPALDAKLVGEAEMARNIIREIDFSNDLIIEIESKLIEIIDNPTKVSFSRKMMHLIDDMQVPILKSQRSKISELPRVRNHIAHMGSADELDNSNISDSLYLIIELIPLIFLKILKYKGIYEISERRIEF